ncbi:hypothetical protein [Botryobacter ruber]|uniref:hypothetical protein n=1 Tax=Botryobacter ruber TaxID=2171629 RepID=UPI000E0BE4D1|nr:hypothetical protein [Botryobacter ruber]
MAQPAKKNGTGSGILKAAGIVLVSLAGLLLVALVVLFFWAEPLVEGYLKKQVAQQTNGRYHLELGEVQLKPFTVSVTLHEVHLYPDTAAFRQQQKSGQAAGSLFELKSPKISFEGIRVLDLLLRNRLNIGTVTARKPAVTHTKVTAGADRSSGNGGSGSRLKSLRIGELRLQEGSYRYLVQGTEERPVHQVPKLTLRVHDLLLDDLQQPDFSQLAAVDDLELEAQQYAYQAPDSVYKVRVGLFSYSTRREELKAEAVEVQSSAKSNRALDPEKASRMLYQLRVPLLQITGLDLPEVWRTKALQLDRFLVQQPMLEMLEDTTVPGSGGFQGLQELYAKLSPYLKAVGMEEFRLADAGFRYRRQQEEVYTIHQLKKASLALQDVQLDSVSLFRPKEKLFAAEAVVTAAEYTYTPLNKPYVLKAEKTELSTTGNYLQATNVRMEGDWNKNDSLKRVGKAQRTFYDISIPQLRFRNLELLKALQTSRLSIGSVVVANPAVGVHTDRQVPKQGEGPDLQEIYRHVSDIFSALEIGNINVTGASLTHHIKDRHVQLLQQLEHASLAATGLTVDSAFVYHPEATLPLDELVLSARHYTYHKPDNTYDFSLGSLRYSTREQVLSAQSLAVNSGREARARLMQQDQASRNRYDISASSVRATGVDLVKALNTGRLSADQVVIRQPDLEMMLDRNIAAAPPDQAEDYANGLFGLLNPVTVTTLRLEDGTFMLREKRADITDVHVLERVSATVSELHLTPASVANLEEALPVQEVRLTAEDYTFLSADSLYTIKLDSVHYSSRSQELDARTFTVNSDKEVNERLKKESPAKASRNLFDIRSKRLRVTGLDLIRAYATGQYTIEEMLLTAPEVEVLQDQNVQARKPKAAEGGAANNQVMEQVDQRVDVFRVERLRVTEGTFSIHLLKDTTRQSHTIPRIAVAIEQLRLVSLDATEPLNIFDFDAFGIVVRDYTHISADSLYALHIKEIRSSLHNHTLAIDSLRYQPLYSKAEYAEKLEFAEDRIDMVVPAIRLQGMSFRALFNNQRLVVQKMQIERPEVEIYRDNRIGINPERKPPTLQQRLLQAGLYIRIDTVELENGKLVHPVIAVNAREPGVLLLEEMQLKLLNVTNDSSLIRQNNKITADAAALFMGKSILKVRFLFYLDHPESLYTYEGTLAPMDFTAFNPLIAPMMFIRVERGQIFEASFSVEATEHLATGRLHFPYSKLKIQLLSKQDPGNPGFMLHAGTWLLNTLVIKSNNPTHWGNFREGEIKKERVYQRSVFHHMSQSLLSGIASSLMPELIYRLMNTITGGL